MELEMNREVATTYMQKRIKDNQLKAAEHKKQELKNQKKDKLKRKKKLRIKENLLKR